MARIAIDPVTRVGGHLRIEADVAAGAVHDAWSSGTMFRGIELLIAGRDPRDAWMLAERVCGTSSSVHTLASVRAVEDALGITIPKNARLIRNLLATTLAVRDHVVQFYLSQLPDWVDVAAALKADPSSTSRFARSLGPWPQSSPETFAAARDRLAAMVATGGPGPFATTYPGHPGYQLPPEQSLMLLTHGIQALDWQRELMKIHTLLGGKDPHPQSYLVGGMSLTPPWGGPPAPARQHPQLPDRNAPSALSEAGLTMVDILLGSARTFVDQVLVPDVTQLAGAYPDWGSLGAGVGNFLAYGDLAETDSENASLYLRGGRIVDRNLASAQPVDLDAVTESVAHAWYAAGDEASMRPAAGETRPEYTGPALPLATFEGATTYSWMKAPRYEGLPMEVGPLARVLVGYVNGQNDIQSALGTMMTTLGMQPASLFSTLGRIVARAVEAQVLAKKADSWLWELRGNLATGDLAVLDGSLWDPSSWPSAAEGIGLTEGPRGAVGHWVAIRDGAVARYQIVDASTWNGSPRDAAGTRGPWEEALVGTPVSDPGQPLEILRTLHAFAPCAACAVHAFAPGSAGPVEVLVRRTETRR
jgi:hydrogenase large subunit